MITSAFPIISTADLPRALTFYRDLLGGNVTYQFPSDGDPGYVALDLGSSHLGLGSAPASPSGPQRIAIWLYVNDCDATVAHLRATVAHLRAAGVTITADPVTQPWGERVARCLDPDGNELIIGQPAPPDTDPELSN